METILKISGFVITAMALGFILGTCQNREGEQIPIVVRPETIVQIRTQDRIILANPDKLQYYVDELNKYRTMPGWTSTSSNRIHAGLYKREWSIEYYTLPKYYNTVFAIGGQQWGAGYLRSIGRFSLGGIVTTEGAGVAAGFQF